MIVRLLFEGAVETSHSCSSAREGCFTLNKMKFRMILGLGIVIVSGLLNLSQGQQLRDAFRKVEQAVVVVKTEQKELAPFPQRGMVSLNGLGSGVLVSIDGKVLGSTSSASS